jgi:nicotinamide riboside transporter PnuC
MIPMVEILGGISTVLALIGTVLVNRRDRRGFYFWLVSNVLVLAVHWQAGIWTLTARDAAFFGLAVHGLYCWRRRQS